MDQEVIREDIHLFQIKLNGQVINTRVNHCGLFLKHICMDQEVMRENIHLFQIKLNGTSYQSSSQSLRSISESCMFLKNSIIS